jgi:hypothetical protein
MREIQSAPVPKKTLVKKFTLGHFHPASGGTPVFYGGDFRPVVVFA